MIYNNILCIIGKKYLGRMKNERKSNIVSFPHKTIRDVFQLFPDDYRQNRCLNRFITLINANFMTTNHVRSNPQESRIRCCVTCTNGQMSKKKNLYSLTITIILLFVVNIDRI